jgi:dipeptidyl aminopeptidase/acylaminoacyl peptidase
MNLWRVPIAEKTGRALGPPEPITTPAPYSAYLSISRDGRRILYSQKVDSANLFKIAFDPSREAVLGPQDPVTQGTQMKNCPNLSKDGQWVVYQVPGKQEDLFLIRPDGSGIRQLTDDIYKDRDPEFSPDGRQIAFYSDRGGTFQMWTVRLDGSEFRQLTDETIGAVGGTWSPDGTRFTYRTPGQLGVPGQLLVTNASEFLSRQNREVLPVMTPAGGSFIPSSWSSGGRLAMGRILGDGVKSGIVIYDFSSRRLEEIAGFGESPRWLRDGRRLIFSGRGKLFLADSTSKRIQELLSLPPNEIQWPTISGDDRLIVFRLSISEADTWLATIK